MLLPSKLYKLGVQGSIRLGKRMIKLLSPTIRFSLTTLATFLYPLHTNPVCPLRHRTCAGGG